MPFKSLLVIHIVSFLFLFKAPISSAQGLEFDISRVKPGIKNAQVRLNHVIDARPEKEALGFVYKGGFNNLKALEGKDIAEKLRYAFQLAMPVPIEQSRGNIILRIKSLSVWERIGAISERNGVDIDYQLYGQVGNDSATLLNSGQIEKEYKGDKTSAHAQHIVELLADAMQPFVNGEWTTTPRKPYTALTELQKPDTLIPSPFRYACLNEKLNDGVLANFRAFRNNKAVVRNIVVNSVELQNANSLSRIIMVTDSNEKRLNNFWGIVYDGTPYVHTGNGQCYELLKYGYQYRIVSGGSKRNPFFCSYVNSTNTAGQTAAFAGGGLLGYLIFDAVARGSGGGGGGSTDQVVPSTLDMVTGRMHPEFVPLGAPIPDDGRRSFAIGVICRHKKSEAYPASVWFYNGDGDTARATLSGRGMVELVLPTSVHEGFLRVEGNRKQLVLLPLPKNTQFRQYFALEPEKKADGKKEFALKELPLKEPGFYEKLYLTNGNE